MLTHQQQNAIENAHRKSQPIYNIHTREISGYAIPDRKTSANVPHVVYVAADVLRNKFAGDENEAFYFIRDLQQRGMLPRMGSEARPLRERDFELAARNVCLGKRFWRWIQSAGAAVREATGYDWVCGFGYYTDSGFIIVSKDGEIIYSVKTE